ncbi:Cap-specific mRNA (nucleoside-2'-O-)-methyltransferase 1(Cap1 2'O-ribose methyltransferase 1) (MTr1) [Durusdinium trenchii]|uniref:Cap-specific mRNA (Nucleoside-2'-O-)-methyltransferase 1(Cap1 2'O-ribose methyltransferase 1) (MTr1) n=1 Tax=Durusdinium trenchii TaxID=1381693 RepID=A0ABP0MDS8_9DINO
MAAPDKVVFHLPIIDAEAPAPDSLALAHSSRVEVSPLLAPERMLKPGYCPAREIEELWREKSRLDELFDAGLGQAYWRAREEIYPEAGDRGGSLGNRAGDKLQEIVDAVGGLQVDRLKKRTKEVEDKVLCPLCMDEAKPENCSVTVCGHAYCTDCITCCVGQVGRCPTCNHPLRLPGYLANAQRVQTASQEPVVFVDVCGAPGAWSKYLFKLGEQRGLQMHGFGFSLKKGTNERSCTWFKQDDGHGSASAYAHLVRATRRSMATPLED